MVDRWCNGLVCLPQVLWIMDSSQTKDCKIGMCCFLAKYAALRRKSKDWMAPNQDNMSEWSNMSIHVVYCFSESSTKQTSSSDQM